MGTNNIDSMDLFRFYASSIGALHEQNIRDRTMKEEIKKEIERQKARIQTEESINKDSDELSFLYYQLHELEKELEKIENVRERI